MATSTETLRIVNEIVYQGKTQARRIRTDLKDIKKGVDDAAEAWRKWSTPLNQSIELLQKVGAGARAVFDQLQAGAQVQAAALTFENLALSIDSTADVMLNDLRAATNGMVSDMELMQSANQFVAMGLANTSDEAATLSEMGATLGAAFRGDAVAGMEEFALLLANQSIPRLDTFGISAGAVRARIAELQEEFPGMNRETAFMTAVLEQGEETMNKLGDTSDTAATHLNTLTARLNNVRDASQEAFVLGLQPFLEGLQTGTTDIDAMSDSVFLLGANTSRTLLTLQVMTDDTLTLAERFEALVAANEAAAEAGGFWTATAEGQAAASRVLLTALTGAGGTGGMVKATEDIAEVTEEAAEATEDYSNVLLRINQRARIAAGGADDLTAAFANWAGDVLPEVQAATEDVTEELGNLFTGFDKIDVALSSQFVETMDFTDGKLSSLQTATQDLDMFLLNLAEQSGATAGELAFLATATGEFTDEQINAAVKMIEFETRLEVIRQRFKDGEISVYQMRDAVTSLVNEMNGIVDKTVTVTVLFDDGGGYAYQGDPLSGPVIESAAGNVFPQGGTSIVGEFGPELVRLPAGSQVVSTNRTLNQSTTNNFNATSRRTEQLIYQSVRRASRPATITG